VFSNSAELYDLIYGQFKDYAEESRRIAAVLARVQPRARLILDAGCGTGEHARRLAADHGYRVDGLDAEPEFVRRAQAKHPAGRIYRADMTDFALPDRYDAVLCLFSAIGYVRTLDNVRRTLANFRAHLAAGGVAIVEPWFQPADWHPGAVYQHAVEAEGVKVCRMSYSTVRDRLSVLEFHYLVGTASGIEHRQETHELGLFTTSEMRDCFTAAGFADVEHDPEGLTGRGLFTARRDG
jgi:SAM-dependent methyltransferase